MGYYIVMIDLMYDIFFDGNFSARIGRWYYWCHWLHQFWIDYNSVDIFPSKSFPFHVAEVGTLVNHRHKFNVLATNFHHVKYINSYLLYEIVNDKWYFQNQIFYWRREHAWNCRREITFDTIKTDFCLDRKYRRKRKWTLSTFCHLCRT